MATPRAIATGHVPGLSVFFPAHDEEANVIATAEGLVGVLPRIASHWELIIVDDGSRDGTAALARALARRDARIRVVTHAEQRGYGAAIRTGLAAARYDLVCFTDGDRQFDPGDLAHLVAALRGADVVIGYRRRRADPLARRLAGAAWTWLVGTTLGVWVRDVNCAFKLLPRRALAGLVLESDGAVVSAELLARLARAGWRLREVPVAHFPRRAGRASGGSLRVIVRAAGELVRLRRRLAAAPVGAVTCAEPPAAAESGG